MDENGNVAEYDELKEGVKYTVIATINGELVNDYEFGEQIRLENDASSAQTEYMQTAGMLEKAVGFLKTYWIWLAVSLCVLSFAVLGIVAAAKKRKYAEVAALEEELSEEAEEIAEEEEEEPEAK